MKKNDIRDNVERIMVYGFYEHQFSDLQGKLLTIIDALGLHEPQNKAVKDMVKSSLWEMYEHAKFMYEYKKTDDGELKLIIRGDGETEN